jgi:Domain of unknown function (DUF4387)
MKAGTTLGELATQVRSKNAGPFWLTLDIFLPDQATFDRVSRSVVTDPEVIGDLYGVDPAGVKVFALANLCAVKISLPRPGVQGSLDDRDMHAGQQYVPLLALPVE